MKNIVDNIKLNKKVESEVLKKSRCFVEGKVEEINNLKERNRYHFMPEVGWMNDPNGFSVYKGEYHLFYQYHPYDTKWGPMHWGHAKSKDLIKWEYLPVALAPDEKYDADGCFSGSAIEVGDKHILMYTGHLNLKSEESENIRQVQCLVIGDGVNYKKAENNPVISTHQLAEDSNLSDFRDPKVWEKNGVFYTVVGNRHKDGSGQILLYKSDNLVEWGLVGKLDHSKNELGKMWECPDLFEVNDVDVLLISPQQMHEEEYRYKNGNATVYFIGDFNYETARFEKTNYDEIDYGLDFYAPQTTLTPDGRRIMIAWMQSWDRNIPSDKYGWVGSMILPRVLDVRNNKLYQNPIKEIESYRINKLQYKNLKLNGQASYDGIKGRVIELHIDVEFIKAKELNIKLIKNTNSYTTVKYDAEAKVLTFDRSASNSGICGLNSRDVKIDLIDNKLNLRVFIDTYSVEIFAQDGEVAMTSTIYTDIEAEDIVFESDDEVNISIEKWELDI